MTVAGAEDWPIALNLLQRLGCGGVVVDTSGAILARNDISSFLVGGWNAALPRPTQKIVAELRASGSRVTWLKRARGGPLILHLITTSRSSATLLVLVDPTHKGRIDENVLRRLFGLTQAEAKLAARVGGGERVRAIAHARGVALGTVRSQLRAIFSKTRTKSQPSLVLLLARLMTIQPDN